jgi:hypothetical protein
LVRGGISAALDLAGKLGKPLKFTQTANDRFIQLGNIGSSLAKLVESYQQNILDSVKEIQGDHELFLAACGEGGFSQRVTTSLTIQASTLYRQLQLFILSSALKANGIVSSRSTGINAMDVARDTGAISCDGLSPGGNCNQWWIDAEAKNTYAFHNPNDWRNTHIELTMAIHDEGWADLAEVFKVEDCAGKAPEFDGTTLGITCLVSELYVWVLGLLTNMICRLLTASASGTTRILLKQQLGNSRTVITTRNGVHFAAASEWDWPVSFPII